MRQSIPRKELDKANKEVFLLVQKIIDTKRRSKDGHKLKRRTGNLRSQIRPFFVYEKGKLSASIEVMEYYQWLDQGTARIAPWFLSEELFDDPKFVAIIRDLLQSSFKVAVIDMVSNIKKK